MCQYPGFKAQEFKRPQSSRLQARFVKESFGDHFEVYPNQRFKKSWVMRNDGDTEWPLDVVFTQTSGENMGAIPIKLAHTVKPGQEYTWEVSMKAPMKIGRYTAFFRMECNSNTTDEKIFRFGHKVSCDILVVEQAIEETKQTSIKQSVKDTLEKPDVLATSFVMEDTSLPGEFLPLDELPVNKPAVDLSQSLNLSSNLVTPKQVYMNKVSCVEPKFAENLKSLFEIGLIDFEKNLAALIEHNNNVE